MEKQKLKIKPNAKIFYVEYKKGSSKERTSKMSFSEAQKKKDFLTSVGKKQVKLNYSISLGDLQ